MKKFLILGLMVMFSIEMFAADREVKESKRSNAKIQISGRKNEDLWTKPNCFIFSYIEEELVSQSVIVDGEISLHSPFCSETHRVAIMKGDVETDGFYLVFFSRGEVEKKEKIIEVFVLQKKVDNDLLISVADQEVFESVVKSHEGLGSLEK